MKQIITGLEALEKLKIGAEKLSACVGSTLGPRGKNVALDRKFTTPLITNDGVSIAREISLPCPFENMGVTITREASIRANDQAGDGTTTACILASSIIGEGYKNIAAGANPILLRKGIEKTCKEATKTLKELSKPISNPNEIVQVASISAGDEEIGKIIGLALDKVGVKGIITIEDSSTSETYVTHSTGYEYDKGLASPYMVTDTTKMHAVLENPYILVVNKKISTMAELLPILEQVLRTGKHLLIIADEIENEPLSALVVNRINGNLPVTVAKAPAFAEKRKQMLSDICTLTGSTLISDEIGTSLHSITLEDLGTAKSVIITNDKTTIIEGKGNAKLIENLAEDLETQIKNTKDNYEKENLKTRLAKLTSGVAVICAGAKSEVECNELKLRIEDALSATRAAIEEGIVPGGGSCLLYISNQLSDFPTTLETIEEQIGANILLEAMKVPIKQIANNSGVDAGKILHIISNQNNFSYGYDALSGSFGDMYEKGIIDPTKVARVALENASSVASTLLTTTVLVTDTPEQNK